MPPPNGPVLPQGALHRSEVALALWPYVALSILGGWAVGGIIPLLSWHTAPVAFALLAVRSLTVGVRLRLGENGARRTRAALVRLERRRD